MNTKYYTIIALAMFMLTLMACGDSTSGPSGGATGDYPSELVATITTNESSLSTICLSGNGRFLYAVDYYTGTVVEIDTETRLVTRTIESYVENCRCVIFSKIDNILYFPGRTINGSDRVIVELNLDTEEMVYHDIFPTNMGPEKICITRTDGLILCTFGSGYGDIVTSNWTVYVNDLNGYSQDICIEPSESEVASICTDEAVYFLDYNTSESESILIDDLGGSSISYGANDQKLYLVTETGSFYSITIYPFEIESELDCGFLNEVDVSELFVLPNGKYAYFGYSNKIVIIDLDSQEIASTLDVNFLSNFDGEICSSPDSKTIYMVDWGYNIYILE